nr:Cof-type HAD-IIB family hydrolase [Dactylosporangium thailandense]
MTLLAFDVDGTLTGPTGHIPEPLRAVLRAVTASGHHVTVISGRSRRSLTAVVDELGLRQPYGAWYGARVAHADGAALHEAMLDPDLVRDLVRLVRPAVREVHAETHDRLYVMEPADAYWDWARNMGFAVLGTGRDLAEPAYKLTLHCPEGGAGAVGDLVRGNHPRLNQFVSDGRFIDVTAADAHKGAALDRVAAELGVAPADIIAFGDDHSDIAMFDRAGLGVAVATRDPVLREAAGLWLPHSGADGLAAWLTDRFQLPA